MTLRERVIGWIWDHRGACLMACVLITLAAGWQAARISVDNSLEIWFAGDDPQLVSYRKYQSVFGNDEVEVIAFDNAGGMLDRPGLALLQRAANKVRRVEGVAGVLSIADLATPVLANSSAAERPQDLELRERLLADPLARGRLTNGDGSVVLLVIRMGAFSDMDLRREAILAGIDSALSELREPYHKAGIGVIYAALNQLSIRDAALLFCVSWLLIALMLRYVLGNWFPVAVCLTIVGTATLWTLGIYAACGRSLNMVTSVMPTLILVIGVAECLHILLHVSEAVRGTDRRQEVMREMAFVLKPCLINMLTTIAGLASLSMSSLPVVRDLGIFSAAGLAGCFVLTVVGCTCALAHRRVTPRNTEDARLRRGAAALTQIGIRWPKLTLATGLVLIAAMAAGASRIVVDTYTIDFLFSDHPVRRDSDFIEHRVGPYLPLEFVVRSRDVLHPEVLHAVERWQRSAQSAPGIGWSYSVVDAIKRIAPDHQVPTGSGNIDAVVTRYRASPGNDLHQLLDDRTALRVTFSVRTQSSRDVEHTMENLLALAQLPEGATAEPIGYLPLYVHMARSLVSSQIQSFAAAFVFIFGLIGLAFRSSRAALLAMPANLLPVFIILGVMGYSGIRLDVATITIASIVLGLVVDDTVHLLHRLDHELKRHRDVRDALRATVDTTGHAILMTTIVLVAGFSVFAFAQIKSVICFGLLIALGLLSGVLADLLLMPALLVSLRSARLKALDTHTSVEHPMRPAVQPAKESEGAK